MSDAPESPIVGRLDEAWHLIDRIYNKVREMAPYAVNTTAWYDAGVPILKEAFAAKDAEIQQLREQLQWQGACTKALLPYQDEAVRARAEIQQLRAKLSALKIVGECRSGGPHYCPNCDNSFSAVKQEAAGAETTVRLEQQIKEQNNDYIESVHNLSIKLDKAEATTARVQALIHEWRETDSLVLNECADALTSALTEKE
jgi:hypothetical protein